MKFHVVGSNGYIARRLLQRLNPDYTVVSYSRHRCPNTIFLDLANPGDANLSQIRPDDFVVIFLRQSLLPTNATITMITLTK